MSRIALIGENSIEYVNALIDIWNAGDCAVLLDWRIPVKTLYSMMLEANVKVCYIEKSLLDKINPVDYPLISFVVYDNTTKEASLLPNDVYIKYKENYSKDEAVVIYSSGTTGRSKGIILSHYAITVNADAIVDYMQPQENDCIYTVRPLSHSSTLTGELLVALRSKCRLLLAPTIVPPRCIFKNIQKHKVTELCVNPTLLSMLCDEKARDCIDISSLKKIYCSGSILDDGIFYKAKSMFGGLEIYNVYGLSEAGPRISAQRYGLCRNNSVGKAINGVEIAIVDTPVKVDTIVLSTQHSPKVTIEQLRKDVVDKIINTTIPQDLLFDDTKILVNPTGRFVVGGPKGDSGLTGRKIVVDTYGGFASHGGGAFSGKDPTKVDRSGAYMARYIAKNIVAAGLAKRCEVQIAYAIGVANPVSILINTYGTSRCGDDKLTDAVKHIFDLRPISIIKQFDLKHPIYHELASYGHMGREDLNVKWEQTDKVTELLEYLRENS